MRILLNSPKPGTDFLGGAHPPPPPPPRHLAPPPKSFCTPSNYTYFDLIFSYLVILITKFVKLLILWFQMPPCRPRKQVLLNIFLGLSGRCHQAPAKASSSTPPPDIYPPHPPPPPPPNENMKIHLWPKLALFCNKNRHSFTSVKHKSKCQSKFFRLTIPTIFYVLGIATDINIQVCKPDYLQNVIIFLIYYILCNTIKRYWSNTTNYCTLISRAYCLAGIYSNTQYLIHHSENN